VQRRDGGGLSRCRIVPALGLDPHPGANSHHDAVLFIDDAIDTAALGLRGDDRFGGGNGGLGAGDAFSDFGFEGAQFGQFRLGRIAIAERRADFASALGTVLGRLRKIIVMGFWRGGRGYSLPLCLRA